MLPVAKTSTASLLWWAAETKVDRPKLPAQAGGSASSPPVPLRSGVVTNSVRIAHGDRTNDLRLLRLDYEELTVIAVSSVTFDCQGTSMCTYVFI